MEVRVTRVERFTLDVPHTEVAGRNMQRQLALWQFSEITRVETNTGHVGIGETLPFYTWGRVTDAAVAETIGQNPFELLYRDDFGAGLQMALWDVAAQCAGVPVYALLGRKVRDEVPIGWWCIDMPPEDRVLEAKSALEQGYTAFKLKGRPWFDVVEQTRAVCEVVPPHFKIDIDFNEHLLDAETALPVLQELETFENVEIFESPIPQRDVPGNQRLRASLRSKIAHHYGNPPLVVALNEGVCDGFVIGCGINAMLRQAHVAAEWNMPFWIQLVGTGITTAWTMHLGAVLTHATWPAITCLNTYSDSLLTEPLVVREGHLRVSDAPGLGVELNEDAVARYRTNPPFEKRPPRWIHRIRFSEEGFTAYCKDYEAYNRAFYARELPVTHRNVRLDSWLDDGSKEFEEMFQRVQTAGIVRVKE